ncbi:MAG TPA: M23 family metallopeptidase [Kofleriaceae bacterium]|nr:M23 family metallopeptidase [Kofleriaceae bacterium]
MWRARLILAAAFSVACGIATALADDAEPAAATETPRDRPDDPRAALAQQLADEGQTIDRTIATVTDKLAAADRARAERLSAAYRLLRAPARDGATLTARRRAAARLLIERDLAERRMLADELAQLATAASQQAAQRVQLPAIVLPETIARPAAGTIARTFGVLVHDRSKATLSRRGLDFEVDARAPVVASEAGIVRYAGPIRGLDLGVIVDHGSFYTVVGKLGELAVPVGAHVGRGDPLGRAARHRVYLEVRVKLGPGGLPIDPAPLLESARQRR